MKIVFDVFYATPLMARQNAMMQAVDIFDKWKVLARHECIEAEFEGDAQKMADMIRTTIEKEGGYV